MSGGGQKCPAVTRSAHDFPEFEHGQRARYVHGCRCVPCTKANRDYARHRYLENAQGRSNPIVSAAWVRHHLLELQAAGVGRHTVADLSGVRAKTVQAIRSGRKTRCRRSTKEKLLAVPLQVWSDGQFVDAGPTWVLLDEMLSDGHTRTSLARELGSKGKTPSLQVGRDQVRASTASKVRRLHARLVPKRPPTWEELKARFIVSP